MNTRAPKNSSFGSQLQFLSTNDRIIKLWNVEYRVRREPITTCEVAEDTGDFGGQCEQVILLPETEVVSEGFEGIERKEYKNCHQYNINSLSVSSDGETFLSADDLRVNLWHIDNNNLAYNVVDLKPSNIEELAEVITYVEHHPTIADLFLFSSSKGYVCTCDLRMCSRFEKTRNAAIYMSEEDPSRKNFFSDIVSSVSRAKFSLRPDEPYIYSRDYLSVHIWDIRKTQTPMQSYHVNDYLEKRLCEVYESEAIFDKFDMQVSPTGSYVLTGSYNGGAHVIDLLNQTNWSIDVKFMDKRGKNVGTCKSYKGKKLLPSSGQSAQIIS